MLEKVDKAFLESALKESISSFEISDGSKPGDNIAGSLKSIKVSTLDGKTIHLVLKLVSDDPEQLDYAGRFGIYDIEACVYNQLNPRITKLVETKAGLSADEAGLPIPRFYGSAYNPGKPTEDYLLLEDVRPLGYKMPDKFKSLSLPEVELIMNELGKFHAKTYYWIQYEGERVFDENSSIKRFRDSLFTAEESEVSKVWAMYMTKNVQSGVEILEEKGHGELAEKIRARLIDYEPIAASNCMKKTLRLTKEGKIFPCIVHGDIWGNNIMIKYNGKGEPESLKFLDFQCTRRGNIFEDLGYFFMCSTTPEFRRSHLLGCLNTYYEAFERTLKKELGVGLPVGFSRGGMIDTFFELRLGFFAHMMFAIPLQLGLPLPEVKKGDKNNGGVPEEEAEGGGGGGFDMSKLSPEEIMAMMEIQFEGKRKMIKELTINSPHAVERLINVAKEAVESGVL